MSAAVQLKTFIDRYDETIADLGRKALAHMRKRRPGVMQAGGTLKPGAKHQLVIRFISPKQRPRRPG